MNARWTILPGLLLLAGCTDEPGWYEESAANQREKDNRIEQFKLQGMDQVQAQRTADFETYWRNTEIAGRDNRPVEGQTLKDVIAQPSE
jgi:hypothetical protein